MVTSWKSASWSATAIVEDCAERGCLKVLKVKNMYQKIFEYFSKSQKHVSENIWIFVTLWIELACSWLCVFLLLRLPCEKKVKSYMYFLYFSSSSKSCRSTELSSPCLDAEVEVSMEKCERSQLESAQSCHHWPNPAGCPAADISNIFMYVYMYNVHVESKWLIVTLCVCKTFPPRNKSNYISCITYISTWPLLSQSRQLAWSKYISQ